VKEYFEIQYKMINRTFKDAGINPMIASSLITLLFVGMSVYLFYKTEYATYIYLILALTLISKLSDMKRTEFLKICFDDFLLKKIRIIENLALGLPFIAFLFYKNQFVFALILLISTIILAIVGFKTKLNFTIWTPFSKRPFEFTNGFRNTFYLFIIAYALTYIAISVKNFNLGVFAILLVFATTLHYYSKPENEYFVWIYNQKPNAFLIGKIKTALLYSTMLVLPIVIMLSIFFYPQIGIILIFIIVGWVFHIYIIVAKYASFPNEMNIVQGIFIALSIMLPPLLLISIPYFFKKSVNRLNNYLK
jgi:hypothetical protein